MAKFKDREDIKNIICSDFYKFYRIYRNKKPDKFKDETQFFIGINSLLKEISLMLSESKDGISLNGLMLITPDDFLTETKENLFKRTYRVTNNYKVTLEDEFLNDKFKIKYYSPRKHKSKIQRKTNPYSVLTHRKELK